MPAHMPFLAIFDLSVLSSASSLPSGKLRYLRENNHRNKSGNPHQNIHYRKGRGQGHYKALCSYRFVRNLRG